MRRISPKKQLQIKIMKKFGLFLIMQNQATPEQINTAMDRQQDLQKTLEKLALEHRLLSMSQVFTILNRQAESGQPFLEIAEELGYLRKDQIKMLFRLQADTAPPIGEILLEMGIINPEKLSEMLTLFRSRPHPTQD